MRHSDEQITAALEDRGTITGAARMLDVDRRRLSERINARPKLAALAQQLRTTSRTRKRTEVSGDAAVLDGEYADVKDPEALMRERGIDPAEWAIDRAVVNEWGRDPTTGEPYGQLKLYLKRVASLDLVAPAVHVPPVKRARRLTPRELREERPRLGVVLSDHHCPYHDPELHERVLAFLGDVRPDFGVLAGDGMDLSSISRHKRNPAYDAKPQTCVQSFYNVARDTVEASTGTTWEYLLGNHDYRLRNYALERAADVYGLAPASPDGFAPEPETTGETIRRLLHLDALGIAVVESPNDGEYERAQANIGTKLGVRHGWLSDAKNGRAMLDKLGHSVVFGHDHRQSVTHLTRWDMDGPKQLVAIGTGTLALIDDGLGYAVNPNWQQGFATVALWPDGTFHVEHATYTAGSLYWRDRRW